MEALMPGGMQRPGRMRSTPVTRLPAPGHPGILSVTFTFQASFWRALPGDLSLNYSNLAEKSLTPYVSDLFTLLKKNVVFKSKVT